MNLNRVVAADRLLASEVGDPAWWAQVATEEAPWREFVAHGTMRVTFIWRDPYGNEQTSPIKRVYIDINSVTHHHSLDPQSLQRIAGTDAWFWQVERPAAWRGSYVFIPVTAEHLPPPAQGDEKAQYLAQRHWWRSIMDLAVSDPLNPLVTHSTDWSGALSALHLPQAPEQSAWHALDTGMATQPDSQRFTALDWYSQRLGKRRKVWMYTTGSAGDEIQNQRPLVLLLDGQRWAQQMPIYSALDFETRRGRLPAAVYVLIDAIDSQQRNEDLSCNKAFWQAIQDELLPWVIDTIPGNPPAECTVVAGQSLGGLAAMYAGLHWPERFNGVLSQSGSFWWPYIELLNAPSGQPCPRQPGAAGGLAEWLRTGGQPAGRLRIFQEVGSHEDVMIDVNDSLHEALIQAGHQVHYQIFEGGHDGLCWRGGLLDGLAWLLAE